MKRIMAFLLAVSFACGCGGGGGDSTGPTANVWSYENENYTNALSTFTKITGTLRNISGEQQHVFSVNYRAWNGDTQIDQGADYIDVFVAPGSAVQYSVLVHARENITRWERWVVQMP